MYLDKDTLLGLESKSYIIEKQPAGMEKLGLAQVFVLKKKSVREGTQNWIRTRTVLKLGF